MSGRRQATTEEHEATRNVFSNIKQLLTHGLFFGNQAKYVDGAIEFLEKAILEMTPKEESETKPNLELVIDDKNKE